tara:strand:- start:360 stop:722 length:363 start_codon:yes stop_codon:yes gene_type:complete
MKLQKFREYINTMTNLSIDGQLKDQGQKAQKIYLDGRRDARSEAFNASRNMERAQKNIEKLLKQIDNAYSRAKKNAKDMGVDLDKTQTGRNFRRTYKEVNDFVSDAQAKTSFIKKLANKI